MVIDELITLIRFDMPGNSAGMLKKAEGAVSSLTKRVRDLGIVSMATGALTSALGVKASDNANELLLASESTDLTIERLQQLESVYRSVGGSAENASKDAEAFFQNFGRTFDYSAMDDLRSFISGKPEAQANMELAAAGFSRDIRRVLELQYEEFSRRMEYAKQFHSIVNQEVEDLKKLDEAMGGFNNRLETVVESLSGKIAPGFTSFFNALEEGLNRNEENFQSWGKSIGSTISGLMEGFRGNIDTINSSLEKERTPEAVSVMQSPDPEVRRKNIERLEREANTKTAGNIAGLIIGSIEAIATDSTILGEIENFRNLQESINAPVKTAEHFDKIATRGQDFAIIDALTSKIMSDLEEEIRNARISGEISKSGLDYHDQRILSTIGAEWYRGQAESLATRIARDSDLLFDKSAQEELISNILPFSNNPEWREDGNGKMELIPTRGIDRRSNVMPWDRPSQSITVQNEININGVRNAEQVAPAVGQAAGSAVQSAFQSNYKLAVPDGSIGHG